MDEIIIDQKKYVSSKRAAEITGYAKDYVGQLCREGRVPARLVGRSWYVLESAIQDHRFGTEHEPKPKVEKDEKEEASVLPPTWESPHYEAVHEDSLPQINRLKVTSTQTVEAAITGDEHDSVTRMRESWKQWFATTAEEPVSEIEEPLVAEEESVPEEKEALHEEEAQESEEPVSIAIHAIHHPELSREIVRELPAEQVVDDREYGPVAQDVSQERKPRTFRTVKALVYFAVFCSIVVGCVGSGFMDKILISEAQGGFFAGISVYNK